MLYEKQISLLHRLKSLGYAPKSIIDCGSALGEWSELARNVFPDPPIFAFDPISYFGGAERYPKISNITFRNTILGAVKNTPVKFYFSKTIPGRSSYLKDIVSDDLEEYNGMINTLDEILPPVNSPIWIKLDTQGSEIDILKGASNIFPQFEVIILEVSTISGNSGGPEFKEVLDFMTEKDFVLYDIFDCGERKEIIAQFDAVFIPRNHPLRDVYKNASN